MKLFIGFQDCLCPQLGLRLATDNRDIVEALLNGDMLHRKLLRSGLNTAKKPRHGKQSRSQAER